MASHTVRFEIHCDNAPEKLTYTHNIPGSLVTVDTQVAQNDPRYVSRFLGAIFPIMKEHEAACRQASNPRCGNCGSPTAKVLQTPMSWLHIVENPFVCVWVNAVCGKDECEMQTRQEIQAVMGDRDPTAAEDATRWSIAITVALIIVAVIRLGRK